MSNSTQTPADALPDIEYPFLFRLTHWLLGGSMIVLILTGFSLHAIARPDWSAFCGQLPSWMWPGRVLLWHLLAAVFFCPAVLAAIVACRGRGVWRRGTQAALLGGGVALAVTGVLLIEPLHGVAWHKAVALVHSSLGLAALPIVFLWHAGGGLFRRRRRLVASFRPLRGFSILSLLFFVPLAALTTWLLVGGWPLVAPWRVLTVPRIDMPAGSVDLAALPWDQAAPLRVKVSNGAGFRSGQTVVVLRALHDGRELFLRAEWDDPTEDRQYRPWKRTADGWERLAGSAEHPAIYYEDKFSLVFPIEPDWRFDLAGCAVSCHAGGGRDYGYKGTDRMIDCWHWKAARTDPAGQVDDQYWTDIDFEQRNVGRRNDPKLSGGYEDNASEDGAHPAALPATPEAARGGAIHAEQTEPYTTEAADALPEGTIIPGIIVSAFLGDRGEVRCQSDHRQGRWTLHVRRRLTTGSPYDAEFVPGGRLPFGVAAFDGTSDRHAYALPVYWMVLGE